MPHPKVHEMLPLLRAVAREQPGIVLLVLFGSRARGEARHDSDWDFAYESAGDVDRLALMASLAEVLKCDDVDVVDLRRASGLLRFRVAREGLLVFEAAPGIFDRFRFAAARFWFDAEPVLLRGYDAILEKVG